MKQGRYRCRTPAAQAETRRLIESALGKLQQSAAERPPESPAAPVVPPPASPDRLCPRCQGEGEVKARVYGMRHGYACCQWRMLLCQDCGGMGLISAAQWEARERGRRLREDRIARCVSLREEARRLGITARELSHQEWGKG
jgi:hypothetical protein